MPFGWLHTYGETSCMQVSSTCFLSLIKSYSVHSINSKSIVYSGKLSFKSTVKLRVKVTSISFPSALRKSASVRAEYRPLFLSCPGTVVPGTQEAAALNRLLINGLFRRAPLLLAHVSTLQCASKTLHADFTYTMFCAHACGMSLDGLY